MNWGVSLFIISAFILVMWTASQTRFKNKMLCRFRRPNHVLIEKWVPMYSKHVIFDNGRYGIGQYTVDPRCIQMIWFNRGINMLFPALIPTLDFRFDTPYPLNPETFETTWQTPEVLNAAWQEHNAQEFAKGAASQVGGKKKEKMGMGIFLAIVAIVLVLGVGFLWWRQTGATAKDMNNLNNKLNTISQNIINPYSGTTTTTTTTTTPIK